MPETCSDYCKHDFLLDVIKDEELEKAEDILIILHRTVEGIDQGILTAFSWGGTDMTMRGMAASAVNIL